MEQLYFIITDECNLNCRHCIRNELNYKGIMPTDRVLENLTIFSQKYPYATCVLSGGEPTLHPDIDKIIDVALDKFSGRVSINTNGTTSFFIKDRFSEHINKRLSYQISLDGSSDYHDIIRGAGKFDIAIDSIKKLLALNMNVNISTTVSEYNIDSIFNMIPIVEKLKVKLWAVQKELPFGNAKYRFKQKIKAEDWNKFCDDFLIAVDNKIRIVMRKMFDFTILDKLTDEQINYYSKKAIKNCGTAKEKLYIHPDNNVYGCTCMEDMPIGNLNEISLDELLECNNYKVLSNYVLKEESICRECRYVKLCNGGCIGMSLIAFGDIGYGDIRCPIVRKHYESTK